MKKFKKITSVMGLSVAVLAGLTLVGCGNKNSTPTPTPTPTPNPEDTPSEVVTQYTVKFDTNGGRAIEDQKVSEGATATSPTNPVKLGYVFAGWFSDEALTEPFLFEKTINADTTLYAKWTPEAIEGTETVLQETYWLNANYDATAGTTYKNVTVLPGATLDTTSTKTITLADGTSITTPRMKLNGNTSGLDNNTNFVVGDTIGGTPTQKSISFTALGEGTVHFYVAAAGSGQRSLALMSSTGEILQVVTTTSSEMVEYTWDIPAAGTYYFIETNGYNFYYIATSCLTEKSAIESISVADSDTEFLKGQELDTSRLAVNLNFENGSVRSVESTDLIVDDSKYNANVPGVYTIDVYHKLNTDLKASYDVVVYGIDSIELGFNRIEKINNTVAGNGQYFNQTVQRVYKLNDTLETEDLTVKVIGKHPTDETKTISFTITNYSVSGFDATTTGEKEITVSFGTGEDLVSDSYKVYVVDTTPALDEENNTISVKVDASYDGVIGTVSEGYNMFNTIQQALDYLGMQDGIGDVRKEIHLAEGTYKEKIEITLPYVSLIGTDAEKTIIEWDSLYGVADEGGFIHTTDSTQTVSVRESAIGCVMEGVTLSNFYNSLKAFDDTLGVGYSEHRALALLVQADQFKMNNCRLLGYQDTVEFFTGRQLIENTYIAGTTDFIFGTNSTTYFKNCQIHSIEAHSNTGDKTDGGYITAFKGCNKGDSDYVQYGAIFDGCNFTADEEVLKEANTAIARTWDKYAAVMVMNSQLDVHISKTDNTSGTLEKNARYVMMNKINIATATTTKFFEYNNTGAGALDTQFVGMTLLTDATVAANYSNYEVIFGATNGRVAYASAWDPTETQIEKDYNTYYYFQGGNSATGTSHTYDGTEVNGTTLKLGEITLDGTVAKIYDNNNSICFNKGSSMTFDVKAGTLVVLETYPGYHGYSINGVMTSSDTFTRYYSEDTTVTVSADSQFYLCKLTIMPDQEAPEAATLSSFKVSGNTLEFTIGDEFAIGDVEVLANYSDNSVVKLSSTDYTVDSSAVNMEAEGTYEVVISYGGRSYTYEVQVFDPSVDRDLISEDTTIVFNTSGNYATSKLGSNYSVAEAKGDTVKFIGDLVLKVLANASFAVDMYGGKYSPHDIYFATDYNDESTFSNISVEQTDDTNFTVAQDGYVVIRSTGCYINKITISYPVVLKTISEDTSILFRTGGNYTDKTLTGNNFTVPQEKDDTCRIDGPVTVKVAAGAKFSVDAYEGYASYAIYTTDAFGNAEKLVANNLSADYTFITEAECVVVIRNSGQNYINAINITFSDATLESYEVTGYTTNLYVGENFTVGDLVVNGIMSDESTINLQYTVDSSAVDMTTAGTYDVVITVEGFEETFTYQITVEEANVVFESTTTIDLSATGANIQTATGKYKGLNIDATTGKFADNNSGWTQVNAGTVITFQTVANAEVSIVANGSVENFTIVVAEDGVCTITCTTNDYLKSITIFVPVVYDKTSTIDLSATGANIQNGTGAYEGLKINATSGKFSDNNGGWTQVNAGLVITFQTVVGATVTYNTYTAGKVLATIEISEDGLCTMTFTASDYINAINIVVPVVYNKSTTIDLSATGANIQNGTGVYEGLNVDATTGKFADNNGGWVQVNSGTIITFQTVAEATVTLTTYSGSNCATIVVDETGLCTITITTNDYINAINIVVPVVYNQSTTIDLSATGANIQNGTGVYEGLNVDATTGKFADNTTGWTQVNAGTIITFQTVAGATVTLTTHSGSECATIVVDETGLCTITITTNDYISAINIVVE